MDGGSYAAETHPFNEALLVLEGVMNLEVQGQVTQVEAGEVYLVPAGLPHAVAPGSRGTLVIIDPLQ
jgi:quercetin dioxygenase-like cupin family protein